MNINAKWFKSLRLRCYKLVQACIGDWFGEAEPLKTHPTLDRVRHTKYSLRELKICSGSLKPLVHGKTRFLCSCYTRKQYISWPQHGLFPKKVQTLYHYLGIVTVCDDFWFFKFLRKQPFDFLGIFPCVMKQAAGSVLKTSEWWSCFIQYLK